jgi:hypothetical protein
MYHNAGYFGGGMLGKRWVYVRVAPIWRVDDFVDDACGICWFRVGWMNFEMFEFDRICDFKDDSIVGLGFC